ncbi:MAG: GAF domain-containing protein [Nitrospinae bacterium]|nr:GAF domain-containing protein [Nitrospinota bacterium]
MDGRRFWGVNPHPFWIIILLISVQYGVNEGLLAALLSGTALLVYNLPEQKITQDIHDYLLEICIHPLMWFSAAVIVGNLRTKQMQELQKIRYDLSDALKREELISSAYNKVNSMKNNLEARIAGQMRSAISIYRAAKSMEALEPEKILYASVELIHAVIKPDKFSIFLLTGNTLEALVIEGWNPDDNFSRTFTQDSALFREVMGRHRVLCIKDKQDEIVLDEEGILAGPLINPDSGNVFGMLKIEAVGFKDLNLVNIESFNILCEWIGTAYNKALQIHK